MMRRQVVPLAFAVVLAMCAPHAECFTSVQPLLHKKGAVLPVASKEINNRLPCTRLSVLRAETDEEEGHATTTPAPKHDVGGGTDKVPDVVMERMQRYQEHQKNAPKLDYATDVRSLIQYHHGFCVVSTNSKSNPGYPGGGVVAFIPDEDGNPIFSFSGLASVTQDVLVDPKCSATIASKDFKSQADGRVNLMGTCKKMDDPEEIKRVREKYLAKHPGAFWVDFGDFNWYKLEVEYVRYVGGFGRISNVKIEDYRAAKPDPIAAFSGPIAQHTNEDHMDSTIQMIYSLVPGMEYDAENPVKEAKIVSVDSLGMYITVTRAAGVGFQPQQFKLRLPFPRPAADRKDVKTLIVELTQASQKAGDAAASASASE